LKTVEALFCGADLYRPMSLGNQLTPCIKLLPGFFLFFAMTALFPSLILFAGQTDF